ncbi:Vitamin B12-dependent ribonucleoside-diphosphate reductase [uncultured archaeon]|nr:Vitamin B12-dependent ribonucleoside-diphosphate reductase [uncultured archaeon]
MNTLDFLSRPTAETHFEDSFSEEVWRTTYKDYHDKDINDTFWRVSKAIASVEKPELQNEWAEKFYDMMTDFKVVPGGRILANAGTEFKGTTLVNCFTSPEPKYDADSIEGILEKLKYQALTLKSEGGYGANFSRIRPRGSFINGIGVETPGVVKFMELFDKCSEIITSGSGIKSSHRKAKGKIRKGAMMGILDVWHPDIIEFITAKQNSGKLTKFNLSVNCTDEFMKKVIEVDNLKRNGSSQEKIDKIVWNLVFPDITFKKYKEEWDGNIRLWEEKGYPIKIYKTVKVSWLWNLITQSTYNRNEPGLVFLDRANRTYTANYVSTVTASNPCQEQTMPDSSACDLGSLNLTQFINEGRTDFDYHKISKYAKYLVRFLDNINDYSNAPLKEYKDTMLNMRRIGCGLMGWASSLFLMRIRFASEKAKKIQQKLMRTFTHAVIEESILLAEIKGKFPLCDPEKHVLSTFWDNIDLSEELRNRMKKYGIRNSSYFSMQPTGNSSVLAQIVSGGIEPIFLPEYIRTVIVTSTPECIQNVTPHWEQGEWKETEMFKFAQEGDEQILKGIAPDGTIYKIDKNRGLTKEILCQDYAVRYLSKLKQWDKDANWAVTTEILSVKEHINDLAGFTKWIDASASKTINVPNDYPFDDFQKVYLDAYKTGFIKGVTTYRQGSMTSVLSAVEQSKTEEEEIIKEDAKLPDSSHAELKILRDHENGGKRKWYVTIILNENSAPVGLFVQTNAQEKTVIANDAVERLISLAKVKGIPEKFVSSTVEKCSQDSNSTKIARAIGLLLRHGVKIKNIVATLDMIGNLSFGSFVFQVKKLLASFIHDGETVDGEICPNCGGKIIYESGCHRCVNCGNSKCS